MVYELVIEDDRDEIFAISLVENPAIEREFIFFNKEEVQFSAIDEEKRLVIGPILIPDKHIFRMDGDNVPYTVFFKKETIAKLAENYLKRGYQASATLEHNKKVDGVSLIESWIVESRTKDKTALFNMNLPIGTWAGVMKIDNDEIWKDYVKTGKVRGFSVEALLEHKLIQASKQNYLSKSVDELTEEEAEELLSKISYLLEAQPSITSTYPGEVATGSLAPALLAELPEMNIYGYETEYFYICPGAVATFNHLINEMNIVDDDLVDMIRAAAVVADNVFEIEADVIKKGKSTSQELERASVLVNMFKDIFQTVDEKTGMKHDISYMDGHIEIIKGLL
jgi:hypothetical protein